VAAIATLKNIVKRFGVMNVVDGIDLELAAGEFVTLLGPSGCGKSTTLRMLAGFETVDAGRIEIEGREVSTLPPNKRSVNMVFQDYALFPHMSVGRNIAFGLKLKGLGRDAINRRVRELLDMVALGEKIDSFPHELSGGQRQRVALARALALEPSILLLDEPLGALDAKLRQQMQEELKRLQKQTGKTFLFVTHDQEEALTMSDRIVVMNKGRIEQTGTPEDIYYRPTTAFVATFIGEANILRGTVEAPAREGRVRVAWHGTSLEAATDRDWRQGEDVVLIVRPEFIRCSRQPQDGGVEGTVTDLMFKGERLHVSTMLKNGDRVSISVDPAGCSLSEGQAVWLGWDPKNAFVFPVS